MNKIPGAEDLIQTACKERVEIETDYYNYLSRRSLEFSSDLQIDFDISSAIEFLEVCFDNPSDPEAAGLDSRFAAQCWSTRFLGFECGMNTPGILWDRLTILISKLIFASSLSKHSVNRSEVPAEEVITQIAGVLEVLHNSMPAKTALLAKEQTARVIEVQSLANSLLKLLHSNLGMWINQDLLYTKDASIVTCSRLKNYITFFGRYNRQRNSAIEEVDLLYRKQYGV